MNKKRSESKKKIKPRYEEEEINESVEEIKENESSKKFSLNKLDLTKSDRTQDKISKKPINKIPKDFKKVWKFVEEMRGRHLAPIESMATEYVSDKDIERHVFKFHTLVALLLSSITTHKIAWPIFNKLIKYGLTIDNIIDTEESLLKEMIHGVAFHNNKAKFIKKLAQKLKDEYDSDPPENLKDCLTLPGIGPKMALLYLQYACNKVEGVGVDTHVHRICNRLKWVNETKSAEHTRKELETWLPKEYWKDINLLLVGFGQTICDAIAPKCQECKLNTSCEFGIERLKKLKGKSSKSRSKSDEKLEKIKGENDNEDKSVKESESKTLEKSKGKSKSVGKSESNLISNKSILKKNKDLYSLKSNARNNIKKISHTPTNGKRKK